MIGLNSTAKFAASEILHPRVYYLKRMTELAEECLIIDL
jgi:hypothetical protein